LNNLINMNLILILFQLDMIDIYLHFLHNMLNNFLDILFFIKHNKQTIKIKYDYGSK